MTRFRLLTGILEPASDITIERVPSGATSSMSTSAGKVWEKPLRRTAIRVATLPMPLTLIVVGYGVALAWSVIVIGVALGSKWFVAAILRESGAKASSRVAAMAASRGWREPRAWNLR